MIDNPNAGITRKIMGTPAFAEAMLGMHKSMQSADSDFPLNIFMELCLFTFKSC